MKDLTKKDAEKDAERVLFESRAVSAIDLSAAMLHFALANLDQTVLEWDTLVNLQAVTTSLNVIRTIRQPEFQACLLKGTHTRMYDYVDATFNVRDMLSGLKGVSEKMHKNISRYPVAEQLIDTSISVLDKYWGPDVQNRKTPNEKKEPERA